MTHSLFCAPKWKKIRKYWLSFLSPFLPFFFSFYNGIEFAIFTVLLRTKRQPLSSPGTPNALLLRCLCILLWTQTNFTNGFIFKTLSFFLLIKEQDCFKYKALLLWCYDVSIKITSAFMSVSGESRILENGEAEFRGQVSGNHSFLCHLLPKWPLSSRYSSLGFTFCLFQWLNVMKVLLK